MYSNPDICSIKIPVFVGKDSFAKRKYKTATKKGTANLSDTFSTGEDEGNRRLRAVQVAALTVHRTVIQYRSRSIPQNYSNRKRYRN